jgi:hypothetical protein
MTSNVNQEWHKVSVSAWTQNHIYLCFGNLLSFDSLPRRDCQWCVINDGWCVGRSWTGSLTPVCITIVSSTGWRKQISSHWRWILVFLIQLRVETQTQALTVLNESIGLFHYDRYARAERENVLNICSMYLGSYCLVPFCVCGIKVELRATSLVRATACVARPVRTKHSYWKTSLNDSPRSGKFCGTACTAKPKQRPIVYPLIYPCITYP